MSIKSAGPDGKLPDLDRILVPIPSERFPQSAVERGMELSRLYDAELLLLYIIEDNVMKLLDRASEMVLTKAQREEMESKLVQQQKEEAEKIHFITVKRLADSRHVDFKKYIRKGRFGHEVSRLIAQEDADLVIMELEEDTIVKFNIVDNCPVPLWLERSGGEKIKEILAVCTNRAPNEYVPGWAADLALKFGAHLLLEYVVDAQKGVDNLTRCGKELLEQATSEFSPDIDLDTKCRSGSLAHIAERDADEVEADLIVLGRATAKKGFFGLTKVDDKVQVARKSNHSVLMIN